MLKFQFSLKYPFYNNSIVDVINNFSPSLVGTLWDVTDGDIDLYTQYIIENWVDASNASLAAIAGDARTICKLSSLVGAAPVVYGLPVKTSICSKR